MKIDKVLFSSSEMFSVLWNRNSRVWREELGIEPVCLLFGKKSNTDMTEEYGHVIEMPVSDRFPLLIQITWSKFWWPQVEPDKTWLVSDIDLFPLSRQWFVDRLASVPDDAYAHLNADGITQYEGCPPWCSRGQGHSAPPDIGHKSNLPGHYHCGLGEVLQRGLDQYGSLDDEIHRLVSSGFRNERDYRVDDPIEQHGMWCAEEHWSTKMVRRAINTGRIKFVPFNILHGEGRVTGDRVDKSTYEEGVGYHCDRARLVRGEYADVHCARPFPHCCSPKHCVNRWDALEDLFRGAFQR